MKGIPRTHSFGFRFSLFVLLLLGIFTISTTTVAVACPYYISWDLEVFAEGASPAETIEKDFSRERLVEMQDSLMNTGPGGNTAEVRCFANLATGSIGTYTYAKNGRHFCDWLDAYADSCVSFRDTLFFTVPAGDYPDGLYVTMSGQIDGILSTSSEGQRCAHARAATSWKVRLWGEEYRGWRQISGDDTSIVSELFSLTIPIVEEGMTLLEQSLVRAPVYARLETWASACGYSDPEALVDFDNTLQITSLDIPQGVTWTSASGVFIPLPTTILLLGSGLACIRLFGRKRFRR